MSKVNNLLVASVTTASVLVVSGVFAKNKIQQHKSEIKESQTREVLINDLQNKNAQLSKDSALYADRKNTYVSKISEYESNHPQYNDIKKLATLVNRMENIIIKNYTNAENKEYKELSTIAKRFCSFGGKYHLKNAYAKPSDIEDFIFIIREHSNQIPQYKAIIAKYNSIKQLDALLLDFDNFVYEMLLYADGRWNPDFDDESLDDYFDDGVRRNNTKDNKYQNAMIEKLLNQYLCAFKKYEKYGIKLMDDKLYSQVVQTSNVIKTHNDIESGVYSYNVALQNVSKTMEENRAKIKDLQVKNR